MIGGSAPGRYWLLIAAIYVLVLAGGWKVYTTLSGQIRQHAYDDLTTISDLKKQEIDTWLHERFNDAQAFSNDLTLLDQLAKSKATDLDSQQVRSRVKDHLEDLARIYHYASVSVFDERGQVWLSTGDREAVSLYGVTARQVMVRRVPELIDLHKVARSQGSVGVSLGIMQPLLLDGRVIGSIYFELDPAEYLFPLVQSWPRATATAETLLVRREGAEVVFLNQLRHASDPPLTRRLTISQKTIPAVRAVLGERGIVPEAPDYRGIPVLAYLAASDQAPWLMVTKIDETEALGEIRRVSEFVGFATVLTLLACTVLVWFWFRQVRSRQTIQQLRLELQDNQLLATIEAIPDAMFEMDTDGRYYAIYDATDHLLAAPAETLLNRTVFEVMPAEAASRMMGALLEAADKGVSRGTQIRLPHEEGEVWIELSIARKTTPPGEKKRLVVLSRNITTQKAAEAELEHHRMHLEAMVAERTSEAVRAKVEAERANRTKSLFLANMSHELRTPMHAILSFAKLGEERSQDATDPNTQKLHQFFGRISQSANRLLLLLNDLLDVAKLESGRMTLDRKPCDVADLIREVCDELAMLAESRHIVFNLAGVEGGSLALCDRMRVGQVISNLVGNAIRFSPTASEIRIGLRSVRLKDSQRMVQVRVQDEGVGIPPGELDRVFEKFVQSSKTATGAGGTGLGLSICRELVDLHGGTIHAENNPERGASFIFTLPAVPEETDMNTLGADI